MILGHEEVARRKPVWTALSDLWLDNELDDGDLSRIAAAMDESGYSPGVLRRIYLHEVAPVVYGNLLTVAGEWAGFDEAWLHAEILEYLRRRNALARRRWRRMRRWLRRRPRGLVRLVLRASRFRPARNRRPRRYLMTYATEHHWKTLLKKVEARRASFGIRPN